MRASWRFAIVIAVAACSVKKPEFVCAEFEDCGPEGACEPGTGACSFPDASCTTSGRRFSDLSTPDYAGQCVAMSMPAGKAELCTADTSCKGGRRCVGGRCASISSMVIGDSLACARCAQTNLPNDPPWCWGSSRFFTQLGFGPFDVNPCLPMGLCEDDLPNNGGKECACAATSPPSCPVERAYCYGSFRANQFAIGLNYFCFATGDVFCAGSNDRSQLSGPPTPAETPALTRLRMRSYDLLAAGPTHTCGRITNQDTIECFGDNTHRQIRDTAEDRVEAPHAFRPFGVATAQVQPKVLALNATATCAASMNDVTCTGEPRWPAGLVEGLPAGPVSSLAVGPDHACVVKDGHLLCWGGNELGQAAPNSKLADVGPTEVVPAVRFTQVVTGRAHTCGITVAGAVMCWGDSSLDQLGAGVRGRGPVTVRTAPTALGPFMAGSDVTCALFADNRIRCWGQVATAPGATEADPDIVLDDFEACEGYRN